MAIVIGNSQRPAQGHEVAVHAAITELAVNFLSQKAPEYGCIRTLIEDLRNGSIREDDYFPRSYRPDLGRFFFHFTPRLNGSAAEADCSSVNWGFGSTACTASLSLTSDIHTNEHAYHNALSSTDLRQRALHLGHVGHLLQDLTSPAHTRNDQHPHGIFFGHDTALDDPDPVEFVNATRTAQSIGLPTVGLLDRTPQQLFEDLQLFTQRNFYSNDTIFRDFTGPLEARRDPIYVYDASDIKIAAIGRYELFIDPTIAREQFDRLGTVAVLYTASLYRKFLEEISFSCLTDNFSDNYLNARWIQFEVPPGFGTPVELNQRLEVPLGSGSGNSGVSSTCSVSGDFDVQVDFELLNWAANNNQGIALGVTGASDAFGGFRVERVSVGSESYHMISNVVGPPVIDSKQIGKLRLVRAGSTLTGYYHNGTQFVPVGSVVMNTAPTAFFLNGGLNRSDAQSAFFVWDNFRVNSRAVSCP